ncbi:MAG: glycosyltransferase [Nitrospiraceae bacterium]|nr:MAG: glycosyltransferase [Nitrospiraceae bacterium]
MKQKIRNLIDDLRGKRTYQRYGEKERRKNRISGQLFSIAVAVAATFYLAWCFFNTQWQYWYMAVAFLVTESVFLLLFLLWGNVLWAKRHHRPEGPPLEKKNFSVDILIPVYREPLEIIEKTLTAAVSIDYADKKIYVLDDGEDDKVRAICEQHHVEYIRRPTHENRKAGNLNYAFKVTTGELILTLDADQVAKPDIIDGIIGYFSLPKIGFVQTKQIFRLPHGDPWGNSDEVFYSVMMSGKDHDNAAFSCGSGVMYRRTAIESVGGFSEWNLVEDVHTSILLHSKGWRSVYHDKSYTEGTAPEDVVSHTKQRWQWAVDSMRIILWDNPLFKKGLDFYQRLQYFHIGFHYVAFGIFLPVFFVIPVWALFTHSFILQEPFWHYIVVRTPYFLLYLLSNRITTYKLHTFKRFQAQAGLFAVFFSAFFTALFSRNRLPQYTVTQKSSSQYTVRSRIPMCLPHIILVLLSVAAIIYGIVTIKNDFWFLAVNVFWASWTIAALWRFVALSLYPKYFIR